MILEEAFDNLVLTSHAWYELIGMNRTQGNALSRAFRENGSRQADIEAVFKAYETKFIAMVPRVRFKKAKS